MAGLDQLLAEAVAQLGTQEAVAQAIGISSSRIGRIRKGEHSLDVLNCLKLAQVVRREPSEVLSIAGKSEVAQMIERMYGSDQSPLSSEERELLSDWGHLDVEERKAFRLLIHGRIAQRRRRKA